MCSLNRAARILHFSIASDCVSSEEDKLLCEMRHAIKDVCADWYSLAIELDIDYGTRKVRVFRVAINYH